VILLRQYNALQARGRAAFIQNEYFIMAAAGWGYPAAPTGSRENRRSGHFRGIAPWRAGISLHGFAEFRRFGSAQQAVGNHTKATFWRRRDVSFGSCIAPQTPPEAKAFDVHISLS
jgi:hypothetical protein